MFQIKCPNCGVRSASEFRYGGVVLTRPKEDQGDAAWLEYVFLRNNTQGLQSEWWYHRMGCQRWFRIERNTQTNIISTSEEVED